MAKIDPLEVLSTQINILKDQQKILLRKEKARAKAAGGKANVIEPDAELISQACSLSRAVKDMCAEYRQIMKEIRANVKALSSDEIQEKLG